MQIIWMFVFGALMVYVAWWLICAIRDRVAFEVEMGLGVGSLWAAGFTPVFFEESPTLISCSPLSSLAGWALLCSSISMFVMAMLSLRRGGKPTSGWENTTRPWRITAAMPLPAVSGSVMNCVSVPLI